MPSPLSIGDMVVPLAGPHPRPVMTVYEFESDARVARCNWLDGWRMRRERHLVAELLRLDRIAVRRTQGGHKV